MLGESPRIIYIYIYIYMHHRRVMNKNVYIKNNPKTSKCPYAELGPLRKEIIT